MSDRGATGKPSSTEEEYFAREEAEKKRKAALQAKHEKAASDLKALKELHWMKCPNCGLELHEVKYQTVRADVCFACGGVFLQKGELRHLMHPAQAGVMAAVLNWFKPETEK